jgi:hypothetical protein
MPSDRPGLFQRIVVVVCVALMTIGLAVPTLLVACSGAAQVKPILRQVDEHVQLACEGLAQALAQRSGADAQKIIATTCAVENITRTMRELLLSAQINAAKRSGVAVPDVDSSALEPDPYAPGEAAAE